MFLPEVHKCVWRLWPTFIPTVRTNLRVDFYLGERIFLWGRYQLQRPSPRLGPAPTPANSKWATWSGARTPTRATPVITTTTTTWTSSPGRPPTTRGGSSEWTRAWSATAPASRASSSDATPSTRWSSGRSAPLRTPSPVSGLGGRFRCVTTECFSLLLPRGLERERHQLLDNDAVEPVVARLPQILLHLQGVQPRFGAILDICR